MTQRRYIVGDEWIYLKIYSGPKTIESIFIHDIMRMVNLLIKQEFVDSFFFIRYMDPNYHIRLRLHCPNIDNYGYILRKINKCLNSYVKNLIISKVELDTYSRELERYAKKTSKSIVYFERIFYYDSYFITKCLRRSSCTDQTRYKITLRFIDSILSKYGFDLDGKINFSEKMRVLYFQEIYQSNGIIGKKLNSKYRDDRAEIYNCFSTYDKDCFWHKEIDMYMSFIDTFPKSVILIQKNELSSIIHMHVNRMYRTKQRIVELVIYWYINKYYRSQKARL